MNERLKELMLEAGYAAPELAGRAQQLAELIVEDVLAIVAPKHDSRTEIFRAHRNLHNKIKEHYGLATPGHCDHVWTVNEHIASNGWLCVNCYESTMNDPMCVQNHAD